MPYIGKSPVGGGFHKLDNLTASSTATYALTLNGAAYYPETANQLLVSLNGVIQAPQDSFTISGSNLVFDSALTASDSIDFVVALGDVLGVGSVTDGAITTAKIGNNAVTSAKLDTNIDIAGTLDSTGVITADAGIKLGTGTDILSSFSQGTWTPEFADASTGGNVSSTTATYANYVKIGSLVHINCRFTNISTSGLTSTGAASLRNLPYASNGEAVGSIWRQNINGSADLVVRLGHSFSYIRFDRQRDNNTDVTLTVANFTNNVADFALSLTYTTDE